MLYSNKTTEDLLKLNQIVSLQNQVKTLRLQGKMKRKIFTRIWKEIQPITKLTKDVPEDVTKTSTETSKESNKAIVILNDKILDLMEDRGVLATFLLSPSSKNINPEPTRQFEPVRDLDSNMVEDLLINKTLPAAQY